MSRICPQCGQPVPEPSADQASKALERPAPPSGGFAAAILGGPLAAVKVAALCVVALGILYGVYRLVAPGEPLATRLFSEQQDVRDRALEELAGLEAAARAQVIEELARNAGLPDPRKRKCSLEAVLRLKLPADDARAVLPGLQAMMREPDTQAALQALAAARHVAPGAPDIQSASMDVIAAQGPRLSTTEYLVVLAGISQTLSTTGEPIRGLPTALGSLVLTTTDSGVRMGLLGLVGQLSSTGQVEAGTVVALGAFSSAAILHALQDPIPAYRTALLAGLMRVMPPSVNLAPQLALLAANSSTILRVTAAEVLMGMSPVSSTAWTAVNGLLKDGEADVRRAAVLAVKPHAAKLPRTVVTTMIGLLKDKDEGVRTETAAVLAPLPTLRVKKALADYAKAKAAAEAAAAAAAAPKAAPTESTAAESAATEDELTEPAATEPATTEPATTEPAATEPAATEPAAAEPAATEPASTAPAATEPAAAAPDAVGKTGPTPTVPAAAAPEPAAEQPAADGASKEF